MSLIKAAGADNQPTPGAEAPLPPAATELEARRRALKAAEDKLAARAKAAPATEMRAKAPAPDAKQA